MFVATRSAPREIDTIKARDAIIAGLLVVGALFLLYAMFLDQGGLLAPFFGSEAFTNNYLHEFAHDARHLLALPCH
ncbi:MAG: hypothetical protein GEV09_20340 [Pseudonocardiaceae bacterium]|nr:hypothetical protein [Pseudonocardiaceae bacterium]